MLKTFRNFSIKQRFVLILMLVFLCLVGTTWLSYINTKHDLMMGKRESTQNVVVVATNLTAYYFSLAQQGVLSSEEAKKQALESIKNLRYGESNSDYVWVNDYNHVMLMHPTNSALNNTSVYDNKDTDGTFLFREMVTLVKEKGECHRPQHCGR